MKSRHFKTCLILSLMACLLIGSNVSAQVSTAIVYSQPPGSGGTLLQSSRWDPNGSDYDQYVWDGFTLPSAREIVEIGWRGGYDPQKFGSGGPVIDFKVSIHASIPAGTQPNVVAPAIVHFQTGGNAGEALAGTVGGTNMYDYKFTLPTPFQASAGTKYWVQIEALQHGIPDWGLAGGTGGDGSYFRRIAYISDFRYQIVPGDSAFTLLAKSTATQQSMTFRSLGIYDGWITETNETSTKGGTSNSASSVFYLGDSNTNRQYRAFLSFDTTALPENAIISSVSLKIRKKDVFGGDPFKTHKGLVVDIRKPFFGNALTLETADFNAAAGKNAVGAFGAVPDARNWYSVSLNSAAFPYINFTGPTQFRLRFRLDDNNDHAADYIRFYSGDFVSAGSRPTLKIVYSLP